MKTKNITQVRLFNASPKKVYDAFMNAKEHAKFTGYTARINKKEGGHFITCGKRNYGYTLKLIPNKRIIQAWSNISFPNSQYSIIDLELKKTGRKTTLVFNHIGFPTDCYKWLNEGWKSTYWDPLNEYLNSQQKTKK